MFTVKPKDTPRFVWKDGDFTVHNSSFSEDASFGGPGSGRYPKGSHTHHHFLALHAPSLSPEEAKTHAIALKDALFGHHPNRIPHHEEDPYIDKYKELKERAGMNKPPATATSEHVPHLLSHFDRLNAEQGGHNLVNFLDLYKAMPHLTREQFHTALLDARKQRHLSLAGAEGRHGVSKEEQAIGIPDDSDAHTLGRRILLFASRRT